MFESAFERRVKDLARQADLKVVDVSSSRAKLLFTVNGSIQPLWIFPYDGGIWEFSCPSVIAVEDASDIPAAILWVVLERNAQNKRGFWCIENIGSKKVLEYMHNIPEQLLTPDEFSKICWNVVREVEQLESAFRELLRGLV